VTHSHLLSSVSPRAQPIAARFKFHSFLLRAMRLSILLFCSSDFSARGRACRAGARPWIINNNKTCATGLRSLALSKSRRRGNIEMNRE
jgi:hypothetical protein